MNYLNAHKTLAVAVVLGLMSVSATALAATVELNLNKAVTMALLNNPTVKISQAELDSAKATKNAANAAHWVSVDYAHNLARSENYKNSTNLNVNNSFKNQVQVSLPLWSPAIDATIKKASANYKYYRYGLEDSLETVKLNATTGYYSVLEAANSVTLAKESVDRLADHLKNVQAQFEVGVVAKADVLRSQVELANAQQTLIKAQNSYDLAVASLNNVIGLPLGTDLSVSEGLDYREYNNTLENCLTYALSNRPVIHQAEANVVAAKAGIDSAAAGQLPSIAASGSYAWQKDKWPGDDKNNWTVGVSLNMNIFDSGVTASKVAAARADKVKAEETYRQTTDSVQLDVRNNYLSLREAEKRIATSQTAVSQAEEDYRISILRYQAGVGTNTDVMDAQVALTQAKNNYIQALYDYNTSGAQLDKAMGVPVIKEEVAATGTAKAAKTK